MAEGYGICNEFVEQSKERLGIVYENNFGEDKTSNKILIRPEVRKLFLGS